MTRVFPAWLSSARGKAGGADSLPRAILITAEMCEAVKALPPGEAIIGIEIDFTGRIARELTDIRSSTATEKRIESAGIAVPTFTPRNHSVKTA